MLFHAKGRYLDYYAICNDRAAEAEELLTMRNSIHAMQLQVGELSADVTDLHKGNARLWYALSSFGVDSLQASTMLSILYHSAWRIILF